MPPVKSSRSKRRKPAAGKTPARPNGQALKTGGPQFAEPTPTPDPTSFSVKHGSDTKAYTLLDHEKGKLKPLPFKVVKDIEPVLHLVEALGDKGEEIVAQIEQAEQIVFHSAGDTGSTRGPESQSQVADKMVADYTDINPAHVPSFFYHLGDVVYSFGEAQYYYDQFYDPYRDYPAPIFAIAGNHDGMVSPLATTPTLQAFYNNFCTAGQAAHRSPEAGDLSRTAQIQPGVYFTLEAPFVRILGLYSNCLEDPGIISDQGGTYPNVGKTQLNFLKAALQRVKTEKFPGAVLFAVHHPPYVAQTKPLSSDPSHNAGRHGGSPLMLKDIDSVCLQTGVWPHAILSGHAHNYQRFTRHKEDRETPFMVCGNGGHALTRLTRKGEPALRVPMDQPTLSDGTDTVTFESYDFTDYGYLRIIVDKAQLRIEYHPASDGDDSKTPDDFVTVDLATRKLVHFVAK
jgi:hypothetical protein